MKKRFETAGRRQKQFVRTAAPVALGPRRPRKPLGQAQRPDQVGEQAPAGQAGQLIVGGAESAFSCVGRHARCSSNWARAFTPWGAGKSQVSVTALRSQSLGTLRLLILASIAIPVLAGQGAELFSERMTGTDEGQVLDGDRSRTPIPPEELTIRSRIVDIDFAELSAVRAAMLRTSIPNNDHQGGDQSEVTLLLNLFDDATYTGIVERTDTTSAGYSLSGRIRGAEVSTFDLVVNGDIVFGSVRTLAATYWIRSGPGIDYWVSEIDYSSFPPPDEPHFHAEDDTQ